MNIVRKFAFGATVRYRQVMQTAYSQARVIDVRDGLLTLDNGDVVREDGAYVVHDPRTIKLSASVSVFEVELAELLRRLEALDPAESVPGEVRLVLEQGLTADSFHIEPLDLGAAASAGKGAVRLRLGGDGLKALVALRAIQGEFGIGHEGLRGQGIVDSQPDSTNTERPSCQEDGRPS